MPIVAPADAPTFDTGGAIITGLASPSRGAADTAAWRVDFNADAPSPKHRLTHQEVFVVLEGAVTATFEEHEETAEAGGALIVPAGTEFSISAKGAPARAICVLPVGGKAIVDGGEFTPPWAE
jgi:quercetin dioxygenase-like cupin family protein